MADDLELEYANGDGAEAAVSTQPESSYVLRDFFRARGEDVPDNLNDDLLADQIGSWAGSHSRFKDVPADADIAELMQYADMGRQYAPHQAKFSEFLQAGQQPPAQQPAAPAKPAGPSQDDIRFAQQVCKKNPQTNIWEPVSPMYADAARLLTDFDNRQAQAQQQLFSDPSGFLKPHLSALLEERLKETLNPHLEELESLREWKAQLDAQQAQQTVFGPRDGEYVVRDQSGNIVSMTPKGESLQQFITQAQQFQNWSDMERLQWAAMQADLAVPNQSQGQGKPPAKSKLPFAGVTPPNGTAPNGAKPDKKPRQTAQMRKQSFVDAGRQRAENGQYLPDDRSATIAAAAKRGNGQNRRQTIEESYWAEKSNQ